jgi:hypothetical protein
LLCKSWLLAHDATLPDDLEYLSRIAHCEVVSDRVLAKFPVVETERGQLRRNQTLYEEWCRASERSDTARERVQRRWGQAEGTETPAATSVSTLVNTAVRRPLVAGGYPTQPEPNRTESNQPVVTEVGSASKANQHNGCDWSTLAVKHKRYFGKQASSTFKEKYAAACKQFGEDVVLDCFEDWSTDAKDWVKNEGVKQPLFGFFKKLPDMAETVVAARQVDVAEAAKCAADAARAQEAQATREKQIAAARLADAAKWDSMSKPSTDNEVSLADYLEDTPTDGQK